MIPFTNFKLICYYYLKLNIEQLKRICEILLECCEPHKVDGENIRQVKAKELVRAAKKAKAPLEP